MRKLLLLGFLLIFGYVVYYMINLLIKKRLVEGFANAANGDPLFFLDEKYNSSIDNPNLGDRDSQYFLMTAIMPGKKDIVNLKETNPAHTSYYYVDNDALSLEQTNPIVVKNRKAN